MKARVIWLFLGMAFVVTVGVTVSQRLSSEAMAVMVGVIAGVAASIPTSLIVVWFVTRTMAPRWESDAAAPRETERSEPRIVVVTPPPPQPAAPVGYPYYAGNPFAAYPAYPLQAAVPPRQFRVIGGQAAEDESPAQEVVWQPSTEVE